MIRVVHLMHDCGIGGVQTIAAELTRQAKSALRYETAVLSAPPAPALWQFAPDVAGAGPNRPSSVLTVLRMIMFRRPDVLVCSLWRSVLVGLCAKLLHRRLHLIIFVHNDHYTHRLDRWAHRIGLRFASAAFADGPASEQLVRHEDQGPRPLPTYVLSVAVSTGGEPVAAMDEHTIGLVFWGRIAAQKRLDRALELVALLMASGESVRLTIAGPDLGEQTTLVAAARRLGIDGNLDWAGPVPRALIPTIAAGQQFFVSLSDFEGFGIAVTEAMQLGLVPVVTAVGDVGRHCDHLHDAIHVDDLADAARTIRAVWADHARWQLMSTRAHARWPRTEDLGAAFAESCRQVIG